MKKKTVEKNSKAVKIINAAKRGGQTTPSAAAKDDRHKTTLILKSAITRSISKVHTATRLQLNQELNRAGIDITPDMYLILRALWERDQRSQQELADDVFKDKASLTKLVVNLEKRGLIYRTEGRADRRSKIVALTPTGNALKDRVYPIVLALIGELEEGFTAADLALMQQMLEKMYMRLKR